MGWKKWEPWWKWKSQMTPKDFVVLVSWPATQVILPLRRIHTCCSVWFVSMKSCHQSNSVEKIHSSHLQTASLVRKVVWLGHQVKTLSLPTKPIKCNSSPLRMWWTTSAKSRLSVCCFIFIAYLLNSFCTCDILISLFFWGSAANQQCRRQDRPSSQPRVCVGVCQCMCGSGCGCAVLGSN